MNMSFMLTTEQIRNGTKTVTRRLGWRKLHPGTILNACVKCQGLKKGEKVDVIRQIKVVSVSSEPLINIGYDDLQREGFPRWTCADFINMFTKHNKCTPETLVTRVEFTYL
jgi:hypothetical protein